MPARKAASDAPLDSMRQSVSLAKSNQVTPRTSGVLVEPGEHAADPGRPVAAEPGAAGLGDVDRTRAERAQLRDPRAEEVAERLPRRPGLAGAPVVAVERDAVGPGVAGEQAGESPEPAYGTLGDHSQVTFFTLAARKMPTPCFHAAT